MYKKKFFIILWGSFLSIILIVVLMFLAIANGFIGYMPKIEELNNPKNNFATEIISSDNVTLGTFFSDRDNRILTYYKDISPNVINALIATEDSRFYSHSGIDGMALARVVVLRGILMQKGAGGGSTITQQLAKLLYSPPATNIFHRMLQKPIEWVIAIQLERLYAKEEIIAMYLNQFDFLYNAVGIRLAAWVYFGKYPDNLTIEEAATLVGMCKNPAYYNPVRREERTLNRRNVVLNQMEKYDYITAAECDSLKKLPMVLNFNRIDHKRGLAPYLREYLRLCMTAKEPHKRNYASWQQGPNGRYHFDSIEWADNPLYGFIEKNPKSDGTKYSIYTDGLKIYTTIDSRMQRYAEEAASEHLKSLQTSFTKEKKGKKNAPYASYVTPEDAEKYIRIAMKQTERYRKEKAAGRSEQQIIESFNTKTEMDIFSWNGTIDTIMTPMDSIRYHKAIARCGFMSMDTKNGHVKAYVGGPNYSFFQYDMVTMGRRQVGSTIKPFLYTLAMNEGFTPCDETINKEITIQDALGRDFTPRNSNRSREGESVTLRYGLATSNNWITTYLMSLFTPEQLAYMMRSFGIKGEIIPVVALCLGPSEVSVSEMTSAYTTFSNNGVRVDPMYVTHIEDANGNIIASFTPRFTEVIDDETNNKMIYMMKGVMNGGSGSRARYRYGVTAPAGGKTGTTQNNSDGWFIGFTPSLSSGCWVGWEDRSVHFSSMVEGQGAAMALPIWSYFMKRVLEDKELGYDATEDFETDSEIVYTCQ